MSDRDAEAVHLIALYRECHYDVRVPRYGRCTLRVGQALPSPLRTWLEDATHFAFLTAYNPYSQSAPAAQNRQRQRALRSNLDELDLRYLAGVGHIPGQDWREPSLFVAGATPAQVDQFAHRYAQNAVITGTADAATVLRLYGGQWCQAAAASSDCISWDDLGSVDSGN